MDLTKSQANITIVQAYMKLKSEDMQAKAWDMINFMETVRYYPPLTCLSIH